MTKLRTHRLFKFAPARLWIIVLFCFAALIASPAQSIFFTTLVSFDGQNGDEPYSSLIQATDGTLYGTTIWGGAYGGGAIFKITLAGTLNTLYSFCSQNGCADGEGPWAALVQATDGNFYGTTQGGGAYGEGTVFKITSEGTLTTLYSFCALGYPCPDGAGPRTGLVQGTDGNFYGTTSDGGSSNYCEGYNCGTVFKITPQGEITTLYSFCSQSGCPDGNNPYDGLVQATDGTFYGTTYLGGSNSDCNAYDEGCGTVFKITPNGALTTLYSFCTQSNCTDGGFPYAELVQGTDGNFYGTTIEGGATGLGVVFKITPSGAFTTLHSFDGPDGNQPYGPLVQANDGNFYGTTVNGGAHGYGTVFQMTSAGTLMALHSFCASGWPCADGAWPFGGLAQARDGSFYGTTSQLGAYGDGTVFRLGVVRTCSTCRP
jgi:uncharacterized repeat protein (TIGR03803 family)